MGAAYWNSTKQIIAQAKRQRNDHIHANDNAAKYIFHWYKVDQSWKRFPIGCLDEVIRSLIISGSGKVGPNAHDECVGGQVQFRGFIPNASARPNLTSALR